MMEAPRVSGFGAQGLHVAGQVAVGQRLALGRTGDAGGVEHRGHIPGLRDRPGGLGLQQARPGIRGILCGVEQVDLPFAGDIRQPLFQPRGGENEARARIRQGVAQILGRHLHIHWHHTAAGVHHAQRRDDPVRAVGGQQHHAVPAFQARLAQPGLIRPHRALQPIAFPAIQLLQRLLVQHRCLPRPT